MQCQHCKSKRIQYKRDSVLLAPALYITNEGDLMGHLVLEHDPVPEWMDRVRLCCLTCGAEQDVEWADERPQHAPFGRKIVHADEALDQLAAYVNDPGPVNGADLFDVVADLLHRSGRQILDNAVLGEVDQGWASNEPITEEG